MELKRDSKCKRARLKSVSKPGRETAPGFSLDGRQRWGARQIFLGMPNTTSAWCTCDLCATCDFWTLKRDSCIKRYPSGVCPSPARETAPGFSLRGRGAPQKRLGFLGPNAGGPKRKRFPAAASPHPKPQNQQRSEENAPTKLEKDRANSAAQGRFVEALNTPVVAPVMCLFDGGRDSLFVNPFKKVTKAPCKFRLLQGACSSPVVCSAPLFLPCSLQGYRAATAAA
jgi:hypothetical protein